MSFKSNRQGIMALESLEDAVKSADVEGNPVQGTLLEGGGASPALGEDAKPKDVFSGKTPEATGSVVTKEGESAVADAAAIAILNVTTKEPKESAEDKIMVMEEAVAGVLEMADQIHEAQEIVQTIDGINERLECAAADGGDHLSPSSAQAMGQAFEHLQQRIGYRGKARWPAMENFGGKMSKQDGTKLALKQGQQMALEAHLTLFIAQEGILAKISNAWSLMWTNEEKLQKRLDEVSSAYDRGTIPEEDLSKPAWGKALNLDKKQRVTGREVINHLLRLHKAYDSERVAAAVLKVADNVDDLTAAISATIFVSGAKDIARIEEAHKQMKATFDEVRADFPDNNKGMAADFEPLAVPDKKKMETVLEDLLKTKRLEQASEKLERAYGSFGREHAVRSQMRLIGMSAQDLRMANRAVGVAWEMGLLTLQLEKMKLRLCHSAVSYIGASARGKKD